MLVDSPQVGANLQDHLITRFAFETHPAGTLNEIMASPVRKMGMGLRYLMGMGGPLATAATEATLFARVTEGATRPEVQFHFSNFRVNPGSYQLSRQPGFMFSFNQCRPESRGSVELHSNDAGDSPRIRANYLSARRDEEVAVSAAKLGLRIARNGPFAQLVHRPAFDSSALQDDRSILEYIRDHATTVYHPSSTCRMGQDDGSVVTPKLAVRGTEALSVVDASVMPDLPSANPQAATMMIAERWLDLVPGAA